MFSNPGHFPFIIKHLPLYALLALMVSALAVMFLSSLRTVQRVTASLTIPRWARPGLGGLAVGVFCVPIVVFVGWRAGAARTGRSACWAAATAPSRSRSAAPTGCRSGGRASRCSPACAWPRSSRRR